MTHGFAFLPSTDLSPLVESAFRGLLLAVLAAGGLKLLRVGNVVAQKAAWLLVLVSAFAMPAVAPLASRIPLSPEDVVHIGLKRSTTTDATPAIGATSQAAIAPLAQEDDGTAALSNSLPPESSTSAMQPAEALGSSAANAPEAVPQKANPTLTRLQFLFLLYVAVCATMLFRLLRGLILAMRLWQTGEQVDVPMRWLLVGSIPVRSSRRITSPLNVGSGILLPADYAQWDEEKLGIVLAHEASHVRQLDFYLQLAAQLYAAIFWFSPLGWWMGRKLSDLSEAISDHAGLNNAASPASYAQVLLEFAALTRPTSTGVAMARPGRLTQRIERLLNENHFHDAFAATPVRVCAAVLLVPIALFAATALVRVQAAQAQQMPTAAPPPMSEPPQQPVVPNPAPELKAPAAPQMAPSPSPSKPAAPATPQPGGPISVQIPSIPSISLATKTPPIPSTAILLNNVAPEAFALAAPQSAPSAGAAGPHHESSGSWTVGRDGEFFGFFQRYGGSPHYTGSWTKGHEDAIDKAEKLAHGDFLLYTNREGKSYYIDDPEIVAQMQALSSATNSLARQKAAMEHAQQELARAQARMAERQKQAATAKPDLQKDLADLNAAIAKLQAEQESTITPQQLADLQRKLGEMQGKLVQMQIGNQLAKMHFENTQLAERLAQLNSEHANTDWNSDLYRDGGSMMKSLIDEAMKDGKAKPLN